MASFNAFRGDINFVIFFSARMKFLDERLDNFSEIIENKFPTKQPVILLMDNINMFRGKHRHDWLYKSLGPKMWNLQVQALLPNLVGIEDLFQAEETCTQRQRPVQELVIKDVLIGKILEFIEAIFSSEKLLCWYF